MMANFVRILLVGSLTFATGSLWAGEWTQFRGPNGTAVSSETGLPTQWSASENIRWVADLPGRGVSSPVIAAGRVYVTCSSGYRQDRLHVLCFDSATGKKLWERQFWATGGTASHPKTCMAGPSPVTDGERVYALFATADVACFDKDGQLLWYRALAQDYPTITNQVGMAASPIVWKDLLIVPMENAGDSFVAGLDKRTGQNRWKVERTRDINWTTPLVFTQGDQTDVLFQSRKEISAYDPESGRKRWTFEGQGLSAIPSPSADRGLVLVPGGEFVALRPSLDQATPEVVWRTNEIKASYASPILHDGRVYAVNNAGVLQCADGKDGSLVWQLRLQGPYSASPVAADGKLYLVNEEGITSVVQLGAEPKVLHKNTLGEAILATPALADGAIFLRSDQRLWCVGKK